MKILKSIDVKINKKGFIYPIDVVQYDTGIELDFNLVDFTIPSGTTATIYIQKPSGKFVYQEKNITISGNLVKVQLDNQALTEYGSIKYQVRLKNGADIITTFTGLLKVDQSLADSGAVESKTVVSSFDSLTASEINKIQTATNNQIALLEAESASQQDLIEAKGAEVLGTIPADYTATHKLANEAIRTKADAIVLSAEGETITVNDSSDDYIRGLTIEGKSTQASYTGKNLLNSNLTTTSANGITCTNNGDGTYTLSGTSTTDSFFPLAEVFTNLQLNTSYKLVGCPNGGGSNTFSLFDNNNSKLDNGTGLIYTATAQPKIFIKIGSGYTCNYLIFKPMLTTDLEATYDDFEPYVGGIPSPSPDYPQEIKSVGDSGSVEVVSCGKNLFDKSTVKIHQIARKNGTIDKSWSDTLSCSDYIKVKPNTTYYFQNIIALSAYYNIVCYDAKKKFLRVVNFSDVNNRSGWLNTGDYTEYIIVNLYTDDIDTVMVELGNKQSPYKPYQGTTATLTLAEPLRSLPNGTKDELIFNSDGTGKIIRRVGKHIMNTTSGGIYNNTDGRKLLLVTPSNKVQSWSHNATSWCSNATLNRNTNSNSGYGFYYENTSNFVFCGTEKDTLQTLREKYNGGELLYMLATPTEEELSAEELNYLKTFYNVTNLSNNDELNPNMILTYNADTKAYIDNKIYTLLNN